MSRSVMRRRLVAVSMVLVVFALSNVLTAIAPDYTSFGSNVAPALRVGAFHFASVTSH